MNKRVLQIHKIIDGKTPYYLREKMPGNRNRLYNLPYVYRELRCRTMRYKNSFFPDAICSWNNLITDFENLPTFGSLKSHVISLIRPKRRSTFGIHDPIHLRHLFQLRVGFSPLRHHKNRHNFADTPTDTCLCMAGPEDTRHFLLICPFYVRHRQSLTSCVYRILEKNNLEVTNDTIDVYLYGHSSLDDRDNRKILEATIEYVKCTNRFST